MTSNLGPQCVFAAGDTFLTNTPTGPGCSSPSGSPRRTRTATRPIWGHVAAVAAIETINAWMHGWRDRGSVGEPPFTAFEAARLLRVGTNLEQTARGLKPESGELPGEALNEWAARIEAILGTEPGADEPIP